MTQFLVNTAKTAYSNVIASPYKTCGESFKLALTRREATDKTGLLRNLAERVTHLFFAIIEIIPFVNCLVAAIDKRIPFSRRQIQSKTVPVSTQISSPKNASAASHTAPGVSMPASSIVTLTAKSPDIVTPTLPTSAASSSLSRTIEPKWATILNIKDRPTMKTIGAAAAFFSFVYMLKSWLGHSETVPPAIHVDASGDQTISFEGASANSLFFGPFYEQVHSIALDQLTALPITAPLLAAPLIDTPIVETPTNSFFSHTIVQNALQAGATHFQKVVTLLTNTPSVESESQTEPSSRKFGLKEGIMLGVASVAFVATAWFLCCRKRKSATPQIEKSIEQTIKKPNEKQINDESQHGKNSVPQIESEVKENASKEQNSSDEIISAKPEITIEQQTPAESNGASSVTQQQKAQEQSSEVTQQQVQTESNKEQINQGDQTTEHEKDEKINAERREETEEAETSSDESDGNATPPVSSISKKTPSRSGLKPRPLTAAQQREVQLKKNYAAQIEQREQNRELEKRETRLFARGEPGEHVRVLSMQSLPSLPSQTSTPNGTVSRETVKKLPNGSATLPSISAVRLPTHHLRSTSSPATLEERQPVSTPSKGGDSQQQQETVKNTSQPQSQVQVPGVFGDVSGYNKLPQTQTPPQTQTLGAGGALYSSLLMGEQPQIEIVADSTPEQVVTKTQTTPPESKKTETKQPTRPSLSKEEKAKLVGSGTKPVHTAQSQSATQVVKLSKEEKAKSPEEIFEESYKTMMKDLLNVKASEPYQAVKLRGQLIEHLKTAKPNFKCYSACAASLKKLEQLQREELGTLFNALKDALKWLTSTEKEKIEKLHDSIHFIAELGNTAANVFMAKRFEAGYKNDNNIKYLEKACEYAKRATKLNPKRTDFKQLSNRLQKELKAKKG